MPQARHAAGQEAVVHHARELGLDELHQAAGAEPSGGGPLGEDVAPLGQEAVHEGVAARAHVGLQIRPAVELALPAGLEPVGQVGIGAHDGGGGAGADALDLLPGEVGHAGLAVLGGDVAAAFERGDELVARAQQGLDLQPVQRGLAGDGVGDGLGARGGAAGLQLADGLLGLLPALGPVFGARAQSFLVLLFELGGAGVAGGGQPGALGVELAPQAGDVLLLLEGRGLVAHGQGAALFEGDLLLDQAGALVDFAAQDVEPGVCMVRGADEVEVAPGVQGGLLLSEAAQALGAGVGLQLAGQAEIGVGGGVGGGAGGEGLGVGLALLRGQRSQRAAERLARGRHGHVALCIDAGRGRGRGATAGARQFLHGRGGRGRDLPDGLGVLCERFLARGQALHQAVQ